MFSRVKALLVVTASCKAEFLPSETINHETWIGHNIFASPFGSHKHLLNEHLQNLST